MLFSTGATFIETGRKPDIVAALRQHRSKIERQLPLVIFCLSAFDSNFHNCEPTYARMSFRTSVLICYL